MCSYTTNHCLSVSESLFACIITVASEKCIIGLMGKDLIAFLYFLPPTSKKNYNSGLYKENRCMFMGSNCASQKVVSGT